MKNIVVASTNPVKVNAVKQAWQAMFPDAPCVVEGQNPHLDLPDQPMGREVYDAAQARLDAIAHEHTDADFWVAIEGGVEMDDQQKMLCNAWIVMRDAKGCTSEARTASFPLPPKLAELILSGMEMGHANDKVFGLTNSKHNQGMTGILTHGVINRTEYYQHAVTLALAAYRNEELYFTEDQA